jgi:hypothetical protein
LQYDKSNPTHGDPGDPGYTLGDIWNEILISCGASKETYSKKTIKYRMAMPQDISPEQLNFINDGLTKGKVYLFLVDEHFAPRKNSATLSTKQQNILSDLTKTRKAIDKYSGLIIDIDYLKENEQHYIERLREEYCNDIKEAAKAGLIWHPWVYNFVYTHIACGNKEILRKIKRGWEINVNYLIKIGKNDIGFINHIDKIEKYRNAGKTWKQVRRILMKKKIIGNISWQALQKKIAKYAPHFSEKSTFMEDSHNIGSKRGD